MKKLLIVLLVIIAIIAIAATVLVGKLDGLVKNAIETEGTAALGSTVTVESVETKLTEGKAIIKGLAIANPSGYKDKHALVIGSFSADVDYENRLIESIEIDKPVINAELTGKLTDYKNMRSNFQDLIENMPEAVEEEPVAEEEGEDLELTINNIALRQATINLTADTLGERSFVMNDLVMTDLSGTADQLSEQITNQLTKHISGEVTAYVKKEAGTILAAAAQVKLAEKANKKINEALSEKLGDEEGSKLGKLKLKFGNN